MNFTRSYTEVEPSLETVFENDVFSVNVFNWIRVYSNWLRILVVEFEVGGELH